MSNTKKTFKDKWEKNPNLLFFDATLDNNSDVHKWILNRNGFKDINQFSKFLKDKNRILELDPIFDNLLHQTFSDTTGEVRRSYDNCRQSCVTGLTLFPEMYETCLADAEERYAKLMQES